MWTWVNTTTSATQPKIIHSASKVRTGCRTCRRRKIKCDETKPSCHRCVAYGVDCGGYEPKAWIQVQSAMPSPLRKPNVKSKRVPVLSYGPAYGTEDETHVLSLYLTTTAVVISEFSSPSFWKVLIPQASWAHPGVKHALVALTWRQNLLRTVRSASLIPDHLSMWHYNRSIRCLIEETPTVEATLLACFLLFTYENTDANYKVSRRHCESGLKMIKEWQSRHKLGSKDNIMVQEIIPRFNEGLAYLQACSTGQPFLPTASIRHPASRSSTTLGTDQEVPDPPLTAIGSFEGVFLNFKGACDALSHCIPKASLTYNSRTATLSPYLLRWRRTLESSKWLKSCHPSLLRMLDVHYYTCRTVGAALHPVVKEEDLAYDAYMDDFLFIVNEMEVLVHDERVRDSFSLRRKLGFIPPLFLTALKCRDAKTRHRAMGLLHTLSNREGRWTSRCAATIAETCAIWEEKSLASQNKRLCGVDGTFQKKPGCEQRLGRVSVEVSQDQQGNRAAFLVSEKLAAPINVELSEEDFATIQWPVSDLLDAYGYQDILV